MNKSESIAELAKALTKAQGAFPAAKKDAKNPFFNTKYADLASVVDAVQEPLAKHGLSLVQFINDADGGVQIETVLIHESGEWMGSAYTMPVGKHDAQGVGSAITYAKRYAIAAICRLATEDDDGNAAVQAKPTAKTYTDNKRVVAHKMAELATSYKPDSSATQTAPPPDESPLPEEVGDLPEATEATLNANNVKQQFALCESIAEWAQVANAWQAESHLHTDDDRTAVKAAADKAKARLEAAAKAAKGKR